jgi:G patch domain/KOW motif-containing protein
MESTDDRKQIMSSLNSNFPSAKSNLASSTPSGSRREVVVDDVSSLGPSGFSGYAKLGYRTIKALGNNTNISLLTPRGSKQPTKKKTLVIPLLQDQFGSSYDDTSSKPSETASLVTLTSTTEPTEEELESKLRKDPFEGVYGLIAPSAGGKASSSSKSKAPLLMRSRPKGWREIEDEDAKLKFELDARPDADQSAYERVAIEDFGPAMLRGMGWKPGVNDGTAVVELVRRPERLGLGAVPKQPPPGSKKTGAHMEYRDADGKVRHVKPAGAQLTSSSPFLSDGTRVSIISGPHDGMHGRIRRLSSDEREYIVDLDNDEQVRVRIKDVETYKTGEKKRSHDSRYDEDSHKSHKRHKTAEIISEASHHSSERHSASVSSSSGNPPKLWITPYIRVKVQSKRFRDGKFYCKKGVVEDIVSGTRCAVRFDDGIVIDDLDQSDLETVIPPIGGRIMVVRGADIGARGIIKEKDNSREVVYVQIEDELDILKFKMDDISEYVE